MGAIAFIPPHKQIFQRNNSPIMPTMKRLSEINPLLRNMILYVMFGCIASGTDALLFACLYYLGSFPWTIANVISVIAGLSVSFTLNRRFNFKVLDHPVRRAMVFFSVGSCGLVLSQLILWIGSTLAANMFLAKIISVIIVGVFQFTLNKIVSFGLDFSKKSIEHA